MVRRHLVPALAGLVAGLLVADGASAAPALRAQVTHRGGFALVGNTLGHDCGSDATPLVGDVVAPCGQGTADSAPDVVWRSEVPAPGLVRADPAFAPSDARTAAVLEVPLGATVTHALLYWAAALPGTDGAATLQLPSGATEPITAVETFTSSVGPYAGFASVADVTALIQLHGSGAYHVSDVELPEWRDTSEAVSFGAWWMVVLYDDAAASVRTTTIFDGLDAVLPNTPQSALFDGIDGPDRGDGVLGAVALGGDQASGGDSISLDGVLLGDAANPVGDVFNGSRTWLGVPVHRAGDLPEMSGAAGSLVGFDLDVFDLAPALIPGAASATVAATTTGGAYWLATLVGSFQAVAPSFVETLKTVVDVDGPPTLAADVLEFTIDVRNTGDGPAHDVVLADTLVPALAFVPGSLAIDGAPATDATGDDRFDFDGIASSLTVRLGAGADATSGGTIAPATSTTVVFRATVADGAEGTVANQATITASGGPDGPWLSGSPAGAGQPTTIVVEGGEGGAGGGGADGGGGGATVATSAATGAASSAAATTSSTSSTSGAGGAGGAAPFEDGGTLHGSGITCATSAMPADARGLLPLLAAALAVLVARRQKR